MKTFTITLLALLVLFCCAKPAGQTEQVMRIKPFYAEVYTKDGNLNHRVFVYTIDDHEYLILSGNGYYGGIIHSENCKHPSHHPKGFIPPINEGPVELDSFWFEEKI